MRGLLTATSTNVVTVRSDTTVRERQSRWMIGGVAEKIVREAAGPVLPVRDATSVPRQSTAGSRSSV